MSDPSRPLIKICGVTRPEDAERAASLGADMIGLNFVPGSPRFLSSAAHARAGRGGDDTRIAEILAAAGDATLVGVFVDEDPGRIEEIAEQAGLALVQLHGDETPEAVRRFGERAIRVFRRDRLPEPAELALYPRVWGFLFDVPPPPGDGRSARPIRPTRSGRAEPSNPAAYGGTGRTWDYEMLAALEVDRPFLVAGGIRPGNARSALIASRAAGVDVCSGIESAPGIKDAERMKQLVEEVRHGTS